MSEDSIAAAQDHHHADMEEKSCDLDQGGMRMRHLLDDPAAEYIPDLYRNLKAREELYRPTWDYMALNQPDLNHSMRTILIDWLIEVAEEYQTSTQTVQIAVSYHTLVTQHEFVVY